MLVIVALLLGLAVLLFYVLGHEEGGVGELLDVRNVVVLSCVYSTHRPHDEREGASYDPHSPPPQVQNGIPSAFDFQIWRV
jgi:hypothetical protein